MKSFRQYVAEAAEMLHERWPDYRMPWYIGRLSQATDPHSDMDQHEREWIEDYWKGLISAGFYGKKPPPPHQQVPGWWKKMPHVDPSGKIYNSP